MIHVLHVKDSMTKLYVKDSKSNLFKESLIYKPFIYPKFEELRKEHEQVHWVTDEVEFSDDVIDWELHSSEDERALIKNILTIFTTGDVAVAQQYKKIFIPSFKNNEVNNWLTSVANRESEHQFAYSAINDALGLPDKIFHIFNDYIDMKNRVEYMLTDYDQDTVEGLILALAHTTFNEGVALFGAFATLLSFHRSDIDGYKGKRGRFKGLCKINKWSLRDEHIHIKGSTLLLKTLAKEHRNVVNDELKKHIYDIARNVVELEDKFIDLAFGNNLIHTINKDDLSKYIRYITDRRLIQMGLKGNFKVKKNPFPWIDELLGGIEKFGNFFETRIDDYQTQNLSGKLNWSNIV